jgi:hypothetical protein
MKAVQKTIRSSNILFAPGNWLISGIVMFLATAAMAVPGVTYENILPPSVTAKMTPAERAAEVPLGVYAQHLASVASQMAGKPAVMPDLVKMSEVREDLKTAKMVADATLMFNPDKEAQAAAKVRLESVAKMQALEKSLRAAADSLRERANLLESRRAIAKAMSGYADDAKARKEYLDSVFNQDVENAKETNKKERLELIAEEPEPDVKKTPATGPTQTTNEVKANG